MAESIVKTSKHTYKVGWKRSEKFTGDPFTYTYGPGVSSLTATDSFNGVKNPAWRGEVRAHVNAGTLANGSRVVVDQVPAYAAKIGSSGGVPAYNTFTDIGPNYLDVTRLSELGSIEPSTSTLTADNQAKTRLQDTLIGFESSAMTGEDLGEIHQTASLLRAPMKGIRELTLDYIQKAEVNLRQLSPRNAQKIVKKLAGDALQWRFGVEPLTKTVAQVVVGLQNRDYLAEYMPFNCSGKHEAVSMMNQGYDSSSSAQLCFMVTGYTKAVTRVRYKGEWKVQSDLDKRAVSDVLRLRWKDAVPTLWNLIPNSFLADYVSNIGDIANSIAVPWSGVAWCNRTSRYEVERFVRTISAVMLNGAAPPYQDKSSYYRPGYTSVKSISFSRDKQVGQPRPQFEIDLGLSGGQLVNTALVIASKLPLLRGLAKNKMTQVPDAHDMLAAEFGQRGHRIPYPFHK
jgi:hypothetical protein